MKLPLSRRHFVALAAAALTCTAQAADPITIIVPYPPGGLSDTLARLTGKVMGQNMGVPVIVENRPGANGVLGLQGIARAKPDGSVIGMVPASVMTVNPALYKNMNVDTVRDITPLTLAITLPNVLVVNPSVPAQNMQELITYLKGAGNKVSYGSMGTGSSAHLNGELLSRSAQLQIMHIPYKGSAPAMQDLVAGNIQMAFENLPVALPMIQSGKLRALGVTSTSSSSQAPDIPPIGKTIPGFEDNIWFGFIAPAGLPPATEKRLNEELIKAIRSDEVSKAMVGRGAAITTSTPDEMRKVIAADREKWGALVRERNIVVE
ncbi:Bug family tripartite tricarboxylate transporter substrate binding protein [Hydrogenophaga sp. UC242_50]|uniref:Bug family tripartite tricarboxylate transporter substrate binding protein n=1 Tax=unclassified Hydrogenophaga TaxID=2610897 RepID=UPI0036D34ED6